MAAIEMRELVGRVIGGKFLLEAFIGDGAIGAVFRGHHETLQKSVAVKILKPTRDGVDRSNVFEREAQTAAQLNHPHCVQVIDFGQDGPDRLAYIAMELLVGKNLEEIVDEEGPLDSRRVAELMMQATAALAAAHDAGVVHRDLKPANLMVVDRMDDDGRPIEFLKVCDFGLAKMLTSAVGTHDSLDGTLTSAVVGTAAYMSPEQASGETLDPRTDLYSLGVVMYQLLTGHTPFMAETFVGMLMKHVTQIPKPLSALEPRVDPELEKVVMRCLEKNRADRFQTARDLRRAISEVISPSTEIVAALPMDAILGTGSHAAIAAAPNPAMAVTSSATTPVLMPRTDDLALPGPEPIGDLDALIADAVNDVTQEIQIRERERTPEMDLFEQAIMEELVGGETMSSIDRRKHAAALSERAQYIWRHYGIRVEPHEGAHSFWIRDVRAEALGPLSYADATKIMMHGENAREASTVSISADGDAWMPVPKFLEMTGQARLIPEGPNPSARPRSNMLQGSLEGYSLPALLGRMARESATGTLHFDNRTHDGDFAFKLHLMEGAPTLVETAQPDLQIPSLLIKKALVSEAVLLGFLHRVLVEEIRLDTILLRDAGIELGMYRAAFMRERITSLFSWRKSGHFRFEPNSAPVGAPFARSVLSLLTEAVYRTMGQAELADAIHPYWKDSVSRSERFARGVKQLGLTTAQLRVASKFDGQRPLGDLLASCTVAEQRLYYTMAYVLLETELLLKPIRA